MRDFPIDVLNITFKWKLMFIPLGILLAWWVIASWLGAGYEYCETPVSANSIIPKEVVSESCIPSKERNLKIVNIVFGFLVITSAVLCGLATMMRGKRH